MLKTGELRVLSVPALYWPRLKITKTIFGFLLENYYLTQNQPVCFDGITIEPNDIPKVIKFFEEHRPEAVEPGEKT
jgi:hypothetical protein